MDLEGSNRQVACGGVPTKRSMGRSPRAGFGIPRQMSVFKAGLAYFGLVFGTGFILGALVLALLIAAELGLTALLSGQTIGASVVSRDPVSGSVHLAMLIVFALMPLFVDRGGGAASDATLAGG